MQHQTSSSINSTESAFILSYLQKKAIPQEPLAAHWLQQLKFRGQTQERLFVLTEFRVLTFKKTFVHGLCKSKSVPLLDVTKVAVVKLDSGGSHMVEIDYNRKKLSFITDLLTEPLIRCLQKAIKNITHNFDNLLRPSFLVPNVWEEIPEELDEIEGFCNTYKAFCDYNSAIFRPGVASYAEACLENENNREIDFDSCFQNCRSPPVDVKDAKALVSALRSCKIFNRMSIRDFALGDEGSKALFEALNHNLEIRGLRLSNVNISEASIEALCRAAEIQAQILHSERHATRAEDYPKNGLRQLDLSRNPISTTMALLLSTALKKFHNGLEVLGLENCGMSIESSCHIISSLRLPTWVSSLKELDYSGNQLGLEGTLCLAKWISSSSALQKLNLANTNLDTELLLESLELNTVLHRSVLQLLDISYNILTIRAGKSLGKILLRTSSLKDVKIRGSKISSTSITDVIRPSLKNGCEKVCISMDLSDNEIGRSKGKVLADAIRAFPSARRERLLLNNCSMSEDTLASVLQALKNCSSLKSLCLNDTLVKKRFSLSIFANPSSMALGESLQSFLFRPSQKELSDNENALIGPPIQELSLSTSESPYPLVVVTACISALKVNSCLQFLDISGCQGGDIVAQALSSALSENRTLKALMWDNNQTSLSGFRCFTKGLEMNYSLILVPVPISDCRRLLDTRSAKREDIFSIFGSIYKVIERNQFHQRDRNSEYSFSSLSSTVDHRLYDSSHELVSKYLMNPEI